MNYGLPYTGSKNRLAEKIGATSKGRKHTQETIEKIRIANSGVNNPNYGKHLSEETIEKLRDANIGDKNPMYGKKLSEDTKAKMSLSHKYIMKLKSDLYKIYKSIGGILLWNDFQKICTDNEIINNT